PSSLPLSSPHSPPHLHLYFSPAPPSPPSSASPVFLSCYAHPPDLHSFPTRRSSDLTYGLTMNAVLKALGMPSAFCESQRADFTRMNPSGALCITDVMHKAFVDVNEEGTEAAAATAVGIGVTSVPASIVVDRPFVFA